MSAEKRKGKQVGLLNDLKENIKRTLFGTKRANVEICSIIRVCCGLSVFANTSVCDSIEDFQQFNVFCTGGTLHERYVKYHK
jgi:hypothetical protein